MIIRTAPRGQHGATLVIVLIMLIVLTMFVVAAVNMSTTNAKVVGNMQAKNFTDAIAQRTIDQVITDNLFVDKRTTPVAPAWKPGYVTVEVTERVCRGSMLQIGDPTLATTVWEFDVCVKDSITGARSLIRQGVTVKTINTGTICPAATAAFAPTSCG